MRKSSLIFLLLTALPAWAQMDYHKTTVTHWAGPGQPGTYAEYLASHPRQPLRWAEIERCTSNLDETGPMLVIVEESIYSSLQVQLDRYLDDLTAEGWAPTMITLSGGTPEDMRAILQDYWASEGILGATLVGDLPIAWYELYEDFDNDGIPDSPWMVQFPCDLFFMDLDGDWYDGIPNGIYDTHLNAWQPDIFVGRLIASPLGDEVSLLANYFAKNHGFRTNQLYLPAIGLAYVDDDWAGSALQWGSALAQATGLAEIISDPDSTTAAGYLDRLDDGYYAILLCAHSSPQLHQFTEQSGTAWNNVYNWQIAQADPQAYFFNLFNCSGCRYTESGYIGGWYIFADTYGLSAVGSTKTGSMLYFEDFYTPIEEGECVGEAFRLWFAEHGQESGSVMWAMSWFYGMTHLGDPTLFMKVGVEVASVDIVDDGTSGSSGDGDGIPDAGETVGLNLTLQNNDPIDHEGVWVELSTTSNYVAWSVDSVYVGNLPAYGNAASDGFLCSVDDDAPDNAAVIVSVQVQDAVGGLWGDNFTLTLRAPDIVLVSYKMVEIIGNGDPFADPDEQFDVILNVKNQGGDDSDLSEVAMNSIGANWILCSHGAVSLPPIPPGEAASTGVPTALGVIILPECPSNYAEPIEVLIVGEPGSALFTPRFLFQVGDQLAWTDPITNPDSVFVHYPLAENYFDQWHVTDYNSYSAPNAWKFGGPQNSSYWPMADGALETPLFKLGDVAELRFNHWMAAEEGYDGGIVEINTGDGWEVLTPNGGYPGTSVSNGSYPGGPCYNGEIGWSEAVFDLSSYAPFARLRFRFASDGGVQEEGWYLDDISLSGDILSGVGQTSAPISPTVFSLGANYPNPFNAETVIPLHLPEKSRIRMGIYDLSARRVAEIYDGFLEAGTHKIRWNVANGRVISSGIYFLKVEGTGELSGKSYAGSGKLLLLK